MVEGKERVKGESPILFIGMLVITIMVNFVEGHQVYSHSILSFEFILL